MNLHRHVLTVLMSAAGQSMNRWSLEEMVKRDPDNFLILLQQIIRKAREVSGEQQSKKSSNPPCPAHFPPTAFRFWRSVSTSWWPPSLSCSPLRCFRYICDIGPPASCTVCSIQLFLAPPTKPLYTFSKLLTEF